jgi:menaquinone-dependent protoporphyrinogen IX oxidase
VDPKFFFSDPDPESDQALTLISDPIRIRFYLMKNTVELQICRSFKHTVGAVRIARYRRKVRNFNFKYLGTQATIKTAVFCGSCQYTREKDGEI